MKIKRNLNKGKNLIRFLSESAIETINYKQSIRFDVYRLFLPGKLNLQWFFTNKCNFDCSYCKVPNSDSIDMTNEERKKGLKNIYKKFRPKSLSITGGEPTIKFDELIDFVSFARRLGIFISLNTNGSLLNSERIKRLANAGLGYLSISYDGIPKKDNKNNLIFLNEASSYGIISAIQPVFSTKNWDKRDEILKIAKEYDALINPTIVNNLNLEYSTSNEKTPKIEEVKKFYKELSLHKIKYKIKSLKNYLKFISENYSNPWKCSDFKWLTINNDGTLKHCNEYSSSFTIEDLLDDRKIKDFNNFRRNIANSCQGCYYECYYESNGSLIKKINIIDYLQLEIIARKKFLMGEVNILFKNAEKYF